MSVWGKLRARLTRLFRRAARAAVPLPGRFEEVVQLYRLQRPAATPEEWSRFALELAGQAYEQGLVRGVDRAAGVGAEEEARRHDWRAGEGRPGLVEALAGRDPLDPLRGVSPEERLRFAAEVSRAVEAGVELRLEVALPGPRPHDRRR